MIKTFDGIKFKGVFRNYQQSVIDNSEKFLSDGRINIVAAPGSGKTILGLELIRRLGFPCIILSPTTTIRHQWGQRFEECFLPENENIDDYVSYDLNEITLINSITYQSLHSCIAKVKTESDDETIDYSNIDIFKLVQKSGVKIICLDESHHLKNEWQKSLEFFLKTLGSDVIIISLTATPPYDATAGEWKRYIGVCGEIDDEIFVPELVKDGTLCPHQDYIYFNFPSEKEREIINLNRTENQQAVDEIYNLPFLSELAARIEAIKNTKETYFYENFYQFRLVLSYLLEKNKCDKMFYKKLTGTRSSEWITVKRIEEVIQFLIDEADLCYEDEKKIIIEILRKHHAYLHNKVCLTLSDSIQKKLVSSTGKLHSITKIAGAEYESLGENLRLLILADYIKKESLSEIGKGYAIDNISVVSIFNELYQNTKIKIGVVSGSVVILPSSLEKMILKNGYSVLTSAINKTGYSVYTVAGGNKEKMALASFLFEEGYVNILIGTQALLGEGWDSPCINSLILASYVGSFMLSNQMRGRAIRAYSKNPEKTANIWHLVTLEPNDFYGCYECVLESSGDFETLKRRFECFVGPDYTTGEVTSGIARVSILSKPFDKDGIEKINRTMIE
ncbi:DEAD/DEAH box helicase family protein, partial [Treponema sp.]|uniref:DEAD/DEAH box helicase family protein n=1 Tax=Treponema sp. TaxID=166 RepID=UPI00298EB79B